MNIIMHLNEEPFNMIKDNIKTIEYRVNDEKRRNLKIGDTLLFLKRPLEKEKIEAVITDLKHYDDLLSMFTATFDRDFKDRYKNPKEVVNDTPYYDEEEIKKYGCVAIYFKEVK